MWGSPRGGSSPLFGTQQNQGAARIIALRAALSIPRWNTGRTLRDYTAFIPSLIHILCFLPCFLSLRELSMAIIEQRTSQDGKCVYRVKVRRKGAPPLTAMFPRLTDAKKWIRVTVRLEQSR